MLNKNLAKLTGIDGASKEVEKLELNQILMKYSKCKILKISNKFITEFSAWSTIQEINYNEIDKIASLCKEIGFDDLTFGIFDRLGKGLGKQIIKT